MAQEIAHIDEYFLYKGKYPISTLSTERYIDEFVEMDVRDDDIFVVAYQRSGTHWMQEIVNLILVKGDLEKLTAKNRHVVIELSNADSKDYVIKKGPSLWAVKDAPSPRVLTTHMVHELLPQRVQEKRCKVIHVYRHGKAVFASKYNLFKKIYEASHSVSISHSPEQFSKFFDAVMAGKCSYGRWFEHVLGHYEHKDNGNCLVVSYEDMKKDLPKIVKKVASFLGHSLNEDEMDRVINGSSLKTMKTSYLRDHAKNVQEDNHAIDARIIIANGTLDEWKEYFTAEQSERFDNTFRELMGNCEWTKPYSPDVTSETLN